MKGLTAGAAISRKETWIFTSEAGMVKVCLPLPLLVSASSLPLRVATVSSSSS